MTNTLPEEFTIQDDFAPIGYDEWRAIVDESLQGAPFERKLVTRTYDGLQIQPIYGRREELEGLDPLGFPGFSPFVRGSRPYGATETGWDLRQEFTAPDLAITNQAILRDIDGGVNSLHLRLDRAACSGLDPDDAAATELAATDGVMAYSIDDFDQALARVPMEKVAVAIDAGSAFVPAAVLLAGLWKKRDIAPEKVAGAFNADPLAALARLGQLPVPAAASLASMAGLAKWTVAQYPNVTAVGVDTSPYHNAGATAAQDIAFATATAVEYLRAMTAAGLHIDDAARQVLFRFGLGTHHFQAISKLRAARQLWSRVVEACGGSRQAQAMSIHARIGDRVLTQYDPYVNLLRNAVAVFAAGLGGANVITSVPFDIMTGLPDDFSRRVARNTVFVLQEESHLERVIDPAGGSWYLDQLTEQLAEKAWDIFQSIESQGGMLSALKAGWVAEQIDVAYQLRAKDIAQRKAGITGVSEFADINLERVMHDPPDKTALRKAAAKRIVETRGAKVSLDSALAATEQIDILARAAASGATLGQLADALGFRNGASESMPALKPHPLAEPFEHLREACDNWQAKHGHRPRVFLATFGPVAHYTARATWSKNFFQAGGFEVVDNQAFENADAAAQGLAGSGAEIAIICSSDKLYPDIVPTAAAKLKAAGARAVVLAGYPADQEQAWRDAGIDRFIFMKCNVLETLQSLLCELGVIEDGGRPNE